MKKIVLMLLFVLALPPAAVSAQTLNGSIYAAQGAPVPILFNFSVTGQTFVVTFLTFGARGNGRWFAAFGTTDEVSGTGQVIMPSGFAFMQPPGASRQFLLDHPEPPQEASRSRGSKPSCPSRLGASCVSSRDGDLRAP
jgi:hypothetical protein